MVKKTNYNFGDESILYTHSEVASYYDERTQEIFKKIKIYSERDRIDTLYDIKQYDMYMLCENKWNNDITKFENFAVAISEAIANLKKIQTGNYKKIPVGFPVNIIRISDENCFYLIPISNKIITILEMDSLDWTPSPCEIWDKSFKNTLNIFTIVKLIYDSSKYVPKDMYTRELNKVKQLNLKGVKIDPIGKNRSRIFNDVFLEDVLELSKDTIESDSSALIRFYCELFKDPEKFNITTFSDRKYLVSEKLPDKYRANVHNYNKFKETYLSKRLTCEEHQLLISRSDELLTDFKRKVRGTHYTPPNQVKICEGEITDYLWPGVKKTHVMHYQCCGVTGIADPFDYAEIHPSTISRIEIALAEGKKHGHLVKKYDMFNDDSFLEAGMDVVNYDMSDERSNSLLTKENHRWGTNPPFGSPSGHYNPNDLIIRGKDQNRLTQRMKSLKYGNAASESYTLSIYKIITEYEHFKYLNKNLKGYLGPIWTRPQLLTQTSFKRFRQEELLKKCKNIKIIALPLGEFYKTGEGLVIVSWWELGEETPEKNKFIVEDYTSGEKGRSFFIYNLDNEKSISDWVNEKETISSEKVRIPYINSSEGPFSIIDGADVKKGLCYVRYKRTVWQDFGLVSTLPFDSSKPAYEENIFRELSCFSIDRLSKRNNNQYTALDEYKYPINTSEFENDVVPELFIYSLFEKKNICCAYNNGFVNQCFPILGEQVKQEANRKSTIIHKNYLRGNKENRFAAKAITNMKISGITKEILDFATYIILRSIRYTDELDSDFINKFSLDCWDRGFYQVRKILEKEEPSLLKAFDIKFKDDFEPYLLERIYNHEILYKNKFEI